MIEINNFNRTNKLCFYYYFYNRTSNTDRFLVYDTKDMIPSSGDG